MGFIRRGPDAPVAPDAPPSVFAAVQEQLGLRLVSAQDEQTTVVIDHVEPPTPD
jgi:uncharacterized protein (TIGR03435 family)